MTASSGRGLWAHIVTATFLGTVLFTVACKHRETAAVWGAESPAASAAGATEARAVAESGTGRWDGCEVLGPGNDAAPPAMIITCQDGRRLSRVEVGAGQFTEEAYRENVDRFIESALGFHVRPESTFLTLGDGDRARVERLVTRVAVSEEGASVDTAMELVGVFRSGLAGSFITCSHPLAGPRGEGDFDGCDEDVRELVANPPWPGSVPPPPT